MCEPLSREVAGFPLNSHMASAHPSPCGPGTKPHTAGRFSRGLGSHDTAGAITQPSQARPREAQHTSPLPGTRTYCASPMDTETELGSVFKALITSMQSVLVTHLLLVLC